MSDPVNAGLMLGSAVVGGIMDFLGARSAKRAQDQAIQRQFEYSTEAYLDAGEKLLADYDYLVESVYSRERNFDRNRAHKDALAVQNYKDHLRINKYQDFLDARLYVKSEELYGSSLAMNAQEAQLADDAAHLQRKELYMAAAFDNENAIIDNIRKSGTALARGVTGRSGAKQQQSQLAAFGRDQAVLAASLSSADNALQTQLRDIDMQYKQANLAAEANRMLKPIPRPDPSIPLASPDMEFLLPRELQEFDFGPPPVKGVNTMPNPTLSFANTVISGLFDYAAAQ